MPTDTPDLVSEYEDQKQSAPDLVSEFEQQKTAQDRPDFTQEALSGKLAQPAGAPTKLPAEQPAPPVAIPRGRGDVSHAAEGYFPPTDIPIQGVKDIAEGYQGFSGLPVPLKQMPAARGQMPRPVQPEKQVSPEEQDVLTQQENQRAASAAKIITGAGEVGTVALPGSIAAAPVSTALSIGAGVLSSKAAGHAVHGKVSPQAEDLVRATAFFLPSVIGTAAGVKGARMETPQGKFSAVEALGGKVRAGIARTPDVTSGRVKIGDTQFEVNIPRNGSSAPAPATPAPALDEATAAMVQYEQNAGNIPKPPPPVPPPTPGQVFGNKLSGDQVDHLAQTIAKAPPDQQNALIEEAHGNMVKWINDNQGKVFIDGKIQISKNPDQTEALAAKIINDASSAHDKATELAAKEQEKAQKEQEKQSTAKTAKPSAPAPAPKPAAAPAKVDVQPKVEAPQSQPVAEKQDVQKVEEKPQTGDQANLASSQIAKNEEPTTQNLPEKEATSRIAKNEVPDLVSQHEAAQHQSTPDLVAEHEGANQRKPENAELRARFDKMSPEERSKALVEYHERERTSEKTGLPNLKAFKEDSEALRESHPHVGDADIDDFKDFNTVLGKDDVDSKVLPVVGEAFQRAVGKEPGGSIKVYHRSGDEFSFLSKDKAAIGRVVDRVNQDLAGVKFTAEAPDGTIHEKTGAGLSHGTGTDTKSAEHDAKYGTHSGSKQSRKEAGLRSGTRDKSGPVGQELAEGKQAGEGGEGGRGQRTAEVAKAPQPGSPEYEALRQKLAARDTRKPVESKGRALVVNQSKKTADRLRTVADGLDKQIEDRQRPMTQNPTPKRMREYRSRLHDGDNMKRVQRAMRALADAHESGTVPKDLANLRTKDEIYRLVYKGVEGGGGYYDVIPSQHYASKTPQGKALQELMESHGKETPAEKTEKEKASKISQLEADVQFQKLPGYFPTPKPVVEKMLDAADIQPGDKVLEPSAGKGNIADLIREREPEAHLSTIEQQSKLRQILELKGHELAGSDFLEHEGKYDKIVMNPPFENGQDIEHVQRAFGMLKPGGKLVAIMSESPFFRSDRKGQAFREWLEEHNGTSEKLEPGAFKESGTGVNARIVEIEKPKAKAAAAEPISTAKQESRTSAPAEVNLRQEKQYNPGSPIKGENGNEARLLTPSGEHAARYRVVESGDLKTSHHALSFAPNKAYPEGVQERQYHTSKEAQNRVIKMAQNYDPAYTINTNPDAVNGPPVIASDGIVLGGNSRAMSTERLYRSGKGNQYKGALLAQAEQFGLDKEAIRKMERPVLVRELTEPPENYDQLRRLGSDLNKSMTGAMGVNEKAASAGKSVTPDTLSEISRMVNEGGDGATLRDVMRQNGPAIVRLMVKDGVITDQERPQFVDTTTGGLSDEGKTFVERALMGSVVDEPGLMDRTPKSVLNKLEGSLADIASLSSRTDEYNILPILRQALEDHAEIAQSGSTVDDHLAQTGMFAPERNPAVDAMVRALAMKPRQFRDALKSYAADANYDVQGQGGFAFGEKPSAVGSFNAAFGTKLTEDEFTENLLQSLEKGRTIGAEKSNDGRQERTPEETTAGLQHDASTPEAAGRPAGSPEARPAEEVEHHSAGQPRDESGQFVKEDDTTIPASESRPAPGARAAHTGNETGLSEIEQLTNSLKNNTPKSSLGERLREGAKLGANGAHGELSGAIGKLKGTFAALLDALKRPPKAGDYENATGKWSGADQRSALYLNEFTKAGEKSVPSKLKQEAISNWIEAGGDDAVLQSRADQSKPKYKPGYEAALKLTDAEKTIARNIMGLHDATLQEAIKAGIVEAGVENYIQHIYDQSKLLNRIRAEMNFSSLQTKPSFSKKRTLPTYFDAEQLGFTPKNKSVFFLTAAHERSLREALAARDYVRALMDGEAEDGRPLTVTNWASAKEIEGSEEKDGAYVIKANMKPGGDFADYLSIDHPALRKWNWSGEIDGKPAFVQGDILVHPDIYRKLKNNLGTSALRRYEVSIGGLTVRPGALALDAQAQIKQFVLSFSGFHQTTLGVHALEHKVLPAGMPELDLSQPEQAGLVDGGLMVAHYDAMEAFGEGVSSGGLVTKIPAIGPMYKTYTDYLFKSYMPRLKMQMALAALERNQARYPDLSKQQLYRLTASQANAAFGGLNYRMIGRNKTFQDTLRLILMAPDFTEARARFAAQAAKPYGREQLVALMLGAAVLYAVARIINEMSDGQPHWDKPFSVVSHGKEYELRTIQSDMINAATDPKKFLQNRVSPPVSAIFKNDDPHYKKKNQSIGDQIKSRVDGMVPVPAEPWMRNSKDSNATKAMESILKMVGVNSKKEPKSHR